MITYSYTFAIKTTFWNLTFVLAWNNVRYLHIVVDILNATEVSKMSIVPRQQIPITFEGNQGFFFFFHYILLKYNKQMYLA